MCYFVTAVLPFDVKPEDHADLLHEYTKWLAPVDNASVLRHVGAGARDYVLGTNMCDCDTCVGVLGRPQSDEGDAVDRKVEKLRRKGWSEAKIRRWLDQRQENKAKKHRIHEQAMKRHEEEAAGWVRFIKRFVAATGVQYFGLLLHWYDGPLYDRIHIRRVETRRLRALTPVDIMQMEEDVLYRLKA